MTARPIAALLCLLACAGLGACGGGGDFSGEAAVPEGYETYAANGISFAYPGDWQVAERTDAEGAPAVEVTPPEKSQTPYGLITLSISPGAGDRFESLADQRRIVVRDVNGGEIESDESVDVPGAREALRATSTTPPGRGTDPVEVKADSLDVLRENDDVVVFTAASPQREGRSFDVAAVVESFRLEG